MTKDGSRATVVSAVLVGVGLAGTLDEVLLHQLLHWHHFYDKTTNTGLPATARLGLLTDGVFHLVSTGLLVAGIIGLRRVRAQGAPTRFWWAGIPLGAGGLNLYDGIVQHKVLKLHEVREGAHPETPYDIAFIAVALALFIAGWVMLRRARPRSGALVSAR